MSFLRFAIAITTICLSLPAQEFRSTLSARVTDPSGAGIPGATAVLTKLDTNTRIQAVTGPDGLVTAPFLAPGSYSLKISASGFKTYLQTALEIAADSKLIQDVSLEIGGSAESVTVSGNSSQLETATASSGETIDARSVENLPMYGRAPLALARNGFGVIPKQKHLLGEVKPYDVSGGVDFALGGANSGSNEYLLDGVPNMSNAGRQSAFSPSMDAVSEVKVSLFDADAAYGNTNGGTVNIVTKSGTNQFHGSAYEYNQTSALAANPFFLNAAGQQQPVTRQNQFGGTIGGPVRIPKLFDGRNKLFFFFSEEQFKDSSPGVTTTSVPTAGERQGDFSSLLGLGSSYQLFDPATGVLNGGKVVRQPFTGNVVPQSRWNPIAVKLLNYFPSPNQPGKLDGSQNYVVPNPSINNFTSYVGRLDASLSDRNKLFFNLHASNYQNSTADIFQNLATGQFSTMYILGGVLDDVHTFTPTLLLDTRLGITRSIAGASIKSNGFDPGSLGFPSYLAANSALLAMPRIAFSDAYAGLSTSPGSSSPYDSTQLFVTLTKVLGEHALKTGVDLRRNQASSLNPGYSSGSFTFGTNWLTQNSTATAQPFGGSLASFLLGLPVSGQFDINASFTNRNYYAALFVQDDWRIRHNLTVNLGLRADHEAPVTEFHNRLTVGFDPAAINAVTKAAQAAYAAHPIAQLPVSAFQPTGGLLFGSDSQRSGYSTMRTFWSPRAGISWSPDKLGKKTVFRAGFGLFNNPSGVYLTGPTTGFSQSNTLVATNNSYLTPYASLSDPFPGNSIVGPAGSAQGINTNLGKAISFYAPELLQSYTIRWSADIQHQLTKDTLLQLSYIGNHQVHLTISNALSALPLQYLSRSPAKDAAVTNALGALVPNPYAGLLPGSSMNGTTTSVASLLAPFSEFGGVTESNLPWGTGKFEMFALRLQKRFSAGLQFSLNYEHSRQLTATTQLNPGDAHLEYMVTSGDFPDHFVLTGSYELPFGKGKPFLGAANRLTSAIAGGWTLNTVYTWESGPALNWGNVIYTGGGLNLQPRNLATAFDTTRFDTVANDQPNSYNFRTFPQMFNNLRADVANNVDLSMLKTFHPTERWSIQYRFEAFNAFNRTQFSAPNLSPTSKAFGTISGAANTPRVIQMALHLRF